MSLYKARESCIFEGKVCFSMLKILFFWFMKKFRFLGRDEILNFEVMTKFGIDSRDEKV